MTLPDPITWQNPENLPEPNDLPASGVVATVAAGAREAWDVEAFPEPPEEEGGVSGWSPVWCGEFLRVLRLVGVPATAARAAGVARQTAYRRRAHDPVFRAAWEDALEHGVDRVERTALRLSTSGVEMTETRTTVKRALFPDGSLRTVEETTVTVATNLISPQMAMFVLRSRRPEVYSERARLELTGKDGEPLIPSELPAIDRMLERKRAELRAITGGHPDVEGTGRVVGDGEAAA